MHTPGPWTASEAVERFYHGNFVQRPSPTHAGSSEPIAVVCDFNRYDRDAEREANARLIAAAPDLLDALVEAVDLFAIDFEGGLEGTADNVGGAWLRQARAAVARATGEETP